jgi:high affinity Mn2+ porin
MKSAHPLARTAHSPAGLRQLKPTLLQPMGLALAACLALGGPALAATDPAVEAQLKLLAERMQQLEKRNQELEKKVQELSRPAAATAALPVAPAPAVAPAAPSYAAAAPVSVDADEADAAERSIEVEGSLLAVAQGVNGGGSADGRGTNRLNYRGDVGVTVPLGSVGAAQATGFAGLRFGQGSGLSLRPTHTATGNSVPFEAGSGSDETYAIVSQVGAQFTWALGDGGFNDLPGTRAELTLGKLDLFGLFDQNAVAADEGAQFLNNVFVHNPLLDSGGDIAADAYGFAPGLRLAYFNEGEDASWGASLGLFGAGEGAAFNGGLGRSLVIGQLEYSPRQINGEPRGTYRLYAWTNGQTTDLAGAPQRHSGYGLSIDQKVGAAWNLFARWGHRTSGDGNFDRALTLGFEHGGRAWGRGNDAVGLAAGWVKTSGAWRSATADGTLAGYSASGGEQIVEAYYRLKLNEHFELSPDFQWIRRPGGDASAPSIKLYGVRAAVGF